jgi:hypothetical protein
MGAADGTGRIYLTEQSVTNSLVRPDRVRGEELVALRSIDSFVAEHKIPHVDLLKIDTEGADLEVLKGAAQTLAAGRVGFVFIEAGFHPGDERHVLFDDIRALLAPHGFSVFGIYDQQLEWSGELRLRFANVCFVNEKALIRNSGRA